MKKLWSYKCALCSLPFQLSRSRSQKLDKATCPCGGQGSFVGPYLPRLRDAAASGIPVQDDPGHARIGVVIENCHNSYIGNFRINGMQTAVLMSGSTNVTIDGGKWFSPVGLEKDDGSTVNISNVDHVAPAVMPEWPSS